MKKVLNARIWYAFSFIIILIVEIIIALYVRDAFIRPYGGDILVTVLICCFVRIFFPSKFKLLPLWVFLFAAAVEFAQYFNFVSLLGLQDIAVLRIMLGTSFSVIDLICYAVGCALFFVTEKILKKAESI